MNNIDKIILSLCGGTGSWERPYKEAGYNVINVTLPEYDVLKIYANEENIILKEMTSIKTKSVYGILAAPPCTMFSFARVRAKKPRDFNEGLLCVDACLRIIRQCMLSRSLKFWCMENPRGYLRQFMGKPCFTFQPYEFSKDGSEMYSKPTELWGYFNLPKKLPTSDLLKKVAGSFNSGNWWWVKSNRKKGLSWKEHTAKTPYFFAEAFFKANK